MYFYRMCFYIFGNEVFLFVLDDTERLRGYYPLCPLYPVQDETVNDVCITSVVSYRIRVYAHTEIGIFVHIIFGVAVFEYWADVGNLECVCVCVTWKMLRLFGLLTIFCLSWQLCDFSAANKDNFNLTMKLAIDKRREQYCIHCYVVTYICLCVWASTWKPRVVHLCKGMFCSP